MKTDKLVYDFAEGNKDLGDLLGGKGANLAEMTHLGLPVPPGFTITTAACRAYLADGHPPEQCLVRAAEDADARAVAVGGEEEVVRCVDQDAGNAWEIMQ